VLEVVEGTANNLLRWAASVVELVAILCVLVAGRCQMKIPATTIIKAIAASDGKLNGHPSYLTRLQMIRLCKAWLKLKGASNV
jgi:hypothetical protein